MILTCSVDTPVSRVRGEKQRPAHLLGCGKCVSSCVLNSSVGGLPRERKRGTALSRDAVFFRFLLSLLSFLIF